MWKKIFLKPREVDMRKSNFGEKQYTRVILGFVWGLSVDFFYFLFLLRWKIIKILAKPIQIPFCPFFLEIHLVTLGYTSRKSMN